MTVLRLLFCFFLLLFCANLTFAAAQSTGEPESLSKLQQENVLLQRQVRRLEAQVSAMRDELNTTDLSQVAGGIGYIVGVFGVAAWLAARKAKVQGR